MARRISFRSRWSRYVPVSERIDQVRKLATDRRRDDKSLSPVRLPVGSRTIATTFWGRSWCENLERYSDFANRLPRGRTYVRNGSVIDLQIAAGKVSALVSGSRIYTVEIGVEKLAVARWGQLRTDCAGGIDSLVELLQGRFSNGVMKLLCRADTGMFPEPRQIAMKCSCPDWATMCKHVAAVLYGVGARLDQTPELLFLLRQVDHLELVTASVGGIEAATAGEGVGNEELEGQDLSALFGIELEATVMEPAPATKKTSRKSPPKVAKAKAQPAARAAPRSRTPRPKPALDPTITSAELRERRVPTHVVQTWLRKGLLEHSGERGIYVRTAATEALVIEFLSAARKHRGTRQTLH